LLSPDDPSGRQSPAKASGQGPSKAH
jgi:hypothetical protein